MMASQIYSRYIPPSKKSVPSIPKQSQPKAQTPPPETPPPTRNDASATYARYIPQSKSKSKAVTVPIVEIRSPVKDISPITKRTYDEFAAESSKVVKKAKKQKNEPTASNLGEVKQDVSELESQDLSGPAGDVREPRQKRKKLRDQQEEEADVKGDSRHRKLIEKRDKSLRKAERLARKSTDHIEEEPAIEEPIELHDLVPLPQPEPAPDAPVQSLSSSLPSWISHPIRISPTATAPFIEVGVDIEVAKGLEKKGFKEAFAVQAAVLPLLLPGDKQTLGDVLVSAATGSGKTLSYILPMIEDISRNQVTKLRGLIVLPTRELVSQAREVSEICSSVFSRRSLRIGVAVGNETFKNEQTSLMDQELSYDPKAYQSQVERLNRKWEDSDYGDGDLYDDEEVSRLPDHIIKPISKVDILICTPGRLVEHLKTTLGFTLGDIQWLVVDEADKLLDQSFQQWLDVVMPTLKSPRKIVLSATMTRDIGRLNGLKLRRPQLVVLEGDEEGTETLFLPSLLSESGIKVEDEDLKPLYLVEILKREGLTSSDDSDFESYSPEPKIQGGVLIFTKSNETAVRLGRLISLLDTKISDKIGTLTSTTRSSIRKSTLKSFEAGKLSILVASDLVSRGLDLTSLAHVINYDIPTSLTSYVHRVGRTARAGKKGHAWTLFTSTEGRWFWNEIGRAEAVKRTAKVERVNISIELLEPQRERYQEVLEELGREASGLNKQ